MKHFSNKKLIKTTKYIKYTKISLKSKEQQSKKFFFQNELNSMKTMSKTLAMSEGCNRKIQNM